MSIGVTSRLGATAAALVALLAGATAQAEEVAATGLQPHGGWNIDYGEDRCRLSRAFGPDGENVLLIDQSATEPFYNLTFIGKPVAKLWGEEAVVQFGPSEPNQRRTYLEGKSPSGAPLVSLFGATMGPVEKNSDGKVLPLGAAREAAIEFVAIRGAKDREFVRLNIGPMAEPLDALRTCAADLEEYLAFDKEEDQRAPVPANDVGDWITSQDYPKMMVQREQEGLVKIKVTVAADGSPTACHIQDSSRPQTFDDVVCLAILKRAKFEPALDAQGNARPAYFNGTISFQLPD